MVIGYTIDMLKDKIFSIDISFIGWFFGNNKLNKIKEINCYLINCVNI